MPAMMIGEWNAASACESAHHLAKLLKSEDGRAPAGNANGELIITIAGAPTSIENIIGRIVHDRIDCEDAIRSIAAHYFRLSPRISAKTYVTLTDGADAAAITWGD